MDKVPSLWKPSDINKLENISLVNKGYNFYKYDYKITEKHLKEIQKNKYDEKNVVMQEGISSTVAKDFESKKDMNLSQFHRMNLSDAMVQQFGPQYPSVKHIRINKDTKGYCWIDDNNKLVAIINTEEKEDDTIWIQAFEIFALYKGHGLSKQILDVAVRQFRVTNLSVNIDNEVALKIYKSYGFKKYKKTDSMIFMSINKSFDESVIEESSIDYSQWKNDKELSAWMKKNIKYTNYTKLMTPDEVYESKKGSCHDQVMFELSALRKMGYKPKALFIIEYNENDDGRDNETHSLVYYEKNNKVYWFENAWGGMEGIHEFKSVQDLKDKLIQLHNSGKMGNCNKYPELEITSFKSHKPGESLQELVDICVNESAINYSNYSFIDIANYEAQKYIKTIKSSIVKYIKNYDGEIIIDTNTDKLIGHVFVGKENTKDEGFILELWVDKKYRRQGLGKQLLTDAIDKYSGYDLIVDKTNTIAIKLYESFGFEIVPAENVKKGQYYMRLKKSIVDEFVARKLKSYIDPSLALKRKMQAKRRKTREIIQKVNNPDIKNVEQPTAINNTVPAPDVKPPEIPSPGDFKTNEAAEYRYDPISKREILINKYTDEDYKLTAELMKDKLHAIKSQKNMCINCIPVERVESTSPRFKFGDYEIKTDKDIQDIDYFINLMNKIIDSSIYCGMVCSSTALEIGSKGILYIYDKDNDKDLFVDIMEMTTEDKELEQAAEKALKMLYSEIHACKDCAYVYETIMAPYLDNKSFAIIRWNLSKLSKNDESEFPKCRDAVFSYCEKHFGEQNRDFALMKDDTCFYITKK